MGTTSSEAGFLLHRTSGKSSFLISWFVLICYHLLGSAEYISPNSEFWEHALTEPGFGQSVHCVNGIWKPCCTFMQESKGKGAYAY